MKYGIELTPEIAEAAHRAVYNSIPQEYREAYLAHMGTELAEKLAGPACAQTVAIEPALAA